MKIETCRPYRAEDAGRVRIAMPDGRSVFKVYYVSITGRDDPARYEWGKAPLGRGEFERQFAASGLEGVGFVTAFPHITKVFRFAPSSETVLHVRALETASLAPLNLDRGGGWVEFACYAEALLANDEYRCWAAAPSVEAYLEAWSSFSEGPIALHSKLLRYWAQ